MRTPDDQAVERCRELLLVELQNASRRRRILFRLAIEELRLIVARRVPNFRCRPAVCVFGGHIVTCVIGRWNASFPGIRPLNDDELRLAMSDLVKVGAIVAQPPFDGMYLIHRCDRN